MIKHNNNNNNNNTQINKETQGKMGAECGGKVPESERDLKRHNVLFKAPKKTKTKIHPM